MLEQILEHLHNWFIVPDGIHHGQFEVKGSSIELPFISSGQYFRIFGSVFNDGLHQYPATDLVDEEFTGTVWALAVPRQVVRLADDVKAWCEKNQPSAYTSESFGGYSYSKATGSNGAPIGWHEVFRQQLNPYRKIRETSFVRGQQPVKPYRRPWDPDHPYGGGY